MNLHRNRYVCIYGYNKFLPFGSFYFKTDGVIFNIINYAYHHKLVSVTNINLKINYVIV